MNKIEILDLLVYEVNRHLIDYKTEQTEENLGMLADAITDLQKQVSLICQ